MSSPTPAGLRALALLALLPLAAGGTERYLVDEIVAVVNRQVITHSEMVQEAVLMLVERKGEQGLQLQITPDFLRRIVELLVNQRVLLDEAHRQGLPPVTEAERYGLLERFKRRFESLEHYTRFLYEHDLNDEAVKDILARHLRTERLKERRLRAMPEVNDEAVRDYFEKNRHQLGGASLSQVAEAIRLKLLTQQREKALAKWVWELRSRSEVKILVDVGEQTGADEGHEAAD